MLSQLINQPHYKENVQKELIQYTTQLLNPYPVARGELISQQKVDDSWEALRSGRF